MGELKLGYAADVTVGYFRIFFISQVAIER